MTTDKLREAQLAEKMKKLGQYLRTRAWEDSLRVDPDLDEAADNLRDWAMALADSAVKVGADVLPYKLVLKCSTCGHIAGEGEWVGIRGMGCCKCNPGATIQTLGTAPDSKVDGMESRLSKVIDQCHEEWLADGTVKEKAAASAVQGTKLDRTAGDVIREWRESTSVMDFADLEIRINWWLWNDAGPKLFGAGEGTREFSDWWDSYNAHLRATNTITFRKEAAQAAWSAALQAERGGEG